MLTSRTIQYSPWRILLSVFFGLPCHAGQLECLWGSQRLFSTCCLNTDFLPLVLYTPGLHLQCLFLVKDSYFGIKACLALVQTLIPSPKRQPVGMVTVTERLLQLGNRAYDELNVRRRPQCGVGTSCIILLKAIERAAHLCPFSDDPQNIRWLLNSTIDLNAFNLLED